MVLLTLAAPAQAALEEYCQATGPAASHEHTEQDGIQKLANAARGSPVAHQQLVDASRYLVRNSKGGSSIAKEARLDALLKGAVVYQPPPPPKPEPTPEHTALMQKLRTQQGQREYQAMINARPPRERFSQRFPHAGAHADDEADELTYSDVKRQMILIINVLVSIICTSVAVWMAARRWSVVPRMLLAFVSSTVVAVAEVAIYMGYIHRIGEAKGRERKQVEKKAVVDTWVIGGGWSSRQQQPIAADSADAIRFRRGKHR